MDFKSDSDATTSLRGLEKHRASSSVACALWSTEPSRLATVRARSLGGALDEHEAEEPWLIGPGDRFRTFCPG
jgi:hypothetical protein